MYEIYRREGKKEGKEEEWTDNNELFDSFLIFTHPPAEFYFPEDDKSANRLPKLSDGKLLQKKYSPFYPGHFREWSKRPNWSNSFACHFCLNLFRVKFSLIHLLLFFSFPPFITYHLSWFFISICASYF